MLICCRDTVYIHVLHPSFLVPQYMLNFKQGQRQIHTHKNIVDMLLQNTFPVDIVSSN